MLSVYLSNINICCTLDQNQLFSKIFIKKLLKRLAILCQSVISSLSVMNT